MCTSIIINIEDQFRDLEKKFIRKCNDTPERAYDEVQSILSLSDI